MGNKNSSSQSSESKPGTGNTQRDQVFFQHAAFHCSNGFQWLLSICLRPQQWSLTNDNTNHVSRAVGWMEMWLWDVAGVLDGTPSHASLICVWFLNLPPGYCPISSFSLHFIKKNKRKKGRNYIKFLQLPHLFRVPNLWEKVINYRAHGSWCCLLGWRPQKLHEGKRNQRKESQGQISNFHAVPGSSIFPLAAGLILQLLGKNCPGKRSEWATQRV